MSTDRDPLERLRVLNPVRAGQLDDLVWQPSAQALFEQIVAGDRGVTFRTRGDFGASPVPADRRRRVPRVAVLAGLASLSVAVAAYALVGRTPSKPHTVACFAAADLGAQTAVEGVGLEGPVAACAGVWARGAFGGTASPSLRACVLGSGVVGVFPEASGQDVCLDLGLASMSPSAPAPRGREDAPPTTPNPIVRPNVEPDEPIGADRFVGFQDTVRTRLEGLGCVGAGPAGSVVREELDRAGLGGWTVAVGVGENGAGFSAELPCASLSFLPEQQTVLLVPVRPAG